MASIVKETWVDASPESAWDALRDWERVHERLTPGFLVDCQVDGPGSRIVTFFNGAVAREVLLGIDEDARRLAYSVVDGPLPFTHHSASARVVAEGDGVRLTWTTDLLPDELAPRMEQMLERGIAVMKETLEAASGTAPASGTMAGTGGE